MYEIAVALSILLSFAFTELFGLLSGGMISAGYMAFYFEQPLRLVSTLILAILICLAGRLLSRYIILYGRRRFMLMVLMSLIGYFLIEKGAFHLAAIPQDLRAIGYIVPGLIANDMYKQGIPKTLAVVVLLAGLVRLILTAMMYL